MTKLAKSWFITIVCNPGYLMNIWYKLLFHYIIYMYIKKTYIHM